MLETSGPLARQSAPTVFLHPIGLDGKMWAEVASERDVCVDFPGHGAVASEADITLARLAEYVAERCVVPSMVVGVSLGGMVALQLAVRYPKAVASLVIMCSTSAASGEPQRLRAKQAREMGMGGVVESTLSRWFTPSALSNPDHPGVKYARDRLLEDNAETFASYWEAMAKHDVSHRLREIRVPTTAVAGSLDVSAGIDPLRKIANGVEDGELEVIEGPHMLPLEAPKAVRDVLSRHSVRVAGGR